MSSIFALSISKLGYIDIFMKIWEKLSSTIWLLNFDYLPDENGKKVDAKNEKNDDDEKNWKSETDFWILHIKIWFYRNFHENLRKKNWPIFKDIFD